MPTLAHQSTASEYIRGSIRTIERDIDLLYRSGFKLLYHGRGWGYSLEAGYKIPLREPEPEPDSE